MVELPGDVAMQQTAFAYPSIAGYHDLECSPFNTCVVKGQSLLINISEFHIDVYRTLLLVKCSAPQEEVRCTFAPRSKRLPGFDVWAKLR